MLSTINYIQVIYAANVKNAKVKTTESYQLEVRDMTRELKAHVELSKVEQKIFLELPNPKCREIQINLMT